MCVTPKLRTSTHVRCLYGTSLAVSVISELWYILHYRLESLLGTFSCWEKAAFRAGTRPERHASLYVKFPLMLRNFIKNWIGSTNFITTPHDDVSEVSAAWISHCYVQTDGRISAVLRCKGAKKGIQTSIHSLVGRKDALYWTNFDTSYLKSRTFKDCTRIYAL
jgi:hypothetical protein